MVYYVVLYNHWRSTGVSLLQGEEKSISDTQYTNDFRFFYPIHLNGKLLASRLFFTASCTWRSHHKWILGSSVNSGWKLVPKTLPCLTATISPESFSASMSTPVVAANLAALPGSLASTSTWFSIASRATWSKACRDGATTVPSRWFSSTWIPSRFGRIFSTTGARINTALNREDGFDGPARKGSSNGAWKLSVWRPKWFRFTRTSSPPMSSWPPCLVRFADSARRISPAQVPQVGLR